MKEENKNEANIKQKNKNNKNRSIIVLSVLMLTLIILYVIFRGSFLEIKEIGEKFESVYWKNVKYMVATLLINFIMIYTLVYITNVQIKNGLKEFFEQENKKMPKFLNKTIAFISAIVISAITSNIILEKAIICFNSAQFGKTDPIFGFDIGYYVFIAPFIKLVVMYFIISTIALMLYKVAYYITTFNMFFDGVDKKTVKNSKLIKQVTTSIFILAILISILLLLEAHSIGTSKFITLKDDATTYSLYGAGLVDVNIKVWGFRVIAIAIVVSVYYAIKEFKKERTKKMILAMSIVPICFVILFFAMAGTQALYVDANEYDKEKGYIYNNIRATKEAYNINIDEVTLSDEKETITVGDVEKFANVLTNIAIADKDVVLKDLNNGQTAKGYYTYRTSQIGEYNINGKNQLVYISPREITNAFGTYDSKTYEQTHGYGTIITSATETKENGNLNHLQKDFENTVSQAITITEPRIYYGLETNDTVVTNSTVSKEFDYPVLNASAAYNEENEYNGKSGLELKFFDRMILAIKEGDLKLAFSGNVNSKSKILINRNIIKRAQTVMPYLKYDTEPYMVITEDGKMVWVLDAYTISNNYPYSQKTILQETQTSKLELNYIRNSVKVLIDAYDGTMQFYITDRTDPIIMAYYNIYSDLFVNLEEQIPTDISSHFVYPKYLYSIQANIITRYHNIQSDVLYRGDDVWDIANHNTGKVLTKTGSELTPYYTKMKTVDNEKEELGLILPYTIYGKQSLISYLIGTCDNEGKTELKIYKYQANSNVLGPMQLDTQIEEDEIIQKEIETLNVAGTKVTKNMICIPLNETVLYVEPIYTQYINENNALPTLRKVIVASGTKVAIGDNIKDALTKLVSKYAVDIEIENTDTIEDLVEAIIKANKNLTTSNESNDWQMIGKDVQRLQNLIDKLEKVVEEEKIRKNEEEAEKEKTNKKDINIEENKINNNLIKDI